MEFGWWMVQRMVLPAAARLLSTMTTFCAMYESRPEVGSSQKSRGGLVRTSHAKASSLDSPPEMPLTLPAIPISVSAHLRDQLVESLRRDMKSTELYKLLHRD